jgi:hypothetical protein
MQNNDRAGKVGVRTLAAIAAIILAFAFFIWGSTSGDHVASNPGPSGIPGSTMAPPPAGGPSGMTTGTAR